ncbi:polysaccharide lyase, putative [Phytophthora infestans T30-4]|uniref:Probable pectate lyase F n=1 Tax=Phytophthora infestans (strain T30-4) TaxID=403677 RepID=D0NB37_PHYIT|nr:polysaccharide lyase, putative [Phytophthora infestans T30-4]EEY55045.1 polysaccharide lyase, putative [Phytophthora infestans T30-4]|eukprot:XP_002903990.1 polysaccharide lyase, putative [Phytophthora infestans T30-4]
MVKLFTPFATSVALLVAAATATAVPDGSWPASTGTVQYAEAYVIKAGEVFDGKMQTFERSDVSCEGQTESNADTAVFMMEPGATLKNAIIGKNQMEGVHCDKHDCTIDNVWWDDVTTDTVLSRLTASTVRTSASSTVRVALVVTDRRRCRCPIRTL